MTDVSWKAIKLYKEECSNLSLTFSKGFNKYSDFNNLYNIKIENYMQVSELELERVTMFLDQVII